MTGARAFRSMAGFSATQFKPSASMISGFPKDEITSSEEMINSLENQKDDLSKEKQNLENPEYVKRFARGKYMVSKPGEQVFKLPAKNNDDDD